jgi:hypothetical protein
VEFVLSFEVKFSIGGNSMRTPEEKLATKLRKAAERQVEASFSMRNLIEFRLTKK